MDAGLFPAHPKYQLACIGDGLIRVSFSYLSNSRNLTEIEVKPTKEEQQTGDSEYEHLKKAHRKDQVFNVIYRNQADELMGKFQQISRAIKVTSS